MLNRSCHKDSIPLCVDLDGTLIEKDSTWIGVKRYLLENPFAFFNLIRWLLKGRAHLKARLSCVISLTADDWVYVPKVLDYIKQEKAKGRKLILVTATDYKLAELVLNDCKIFDGLLASDGKINLRAHEKRRACEQKFGFEKFDYIGNSEDDLVVWPSSRKAILSPLTPARVRAQIKKLDPEKIIIL